MKNLRIAFFASALLAGVTGAFAYGNTQDCTGQLYGKVSNSEIFTAVGATAADQTLSNYIAVNPGDYTCATANPPVCVYYLDNGTIRQCAKGTFSLQ